MRPQPLSLLLGLVLCACSPAPDTPAAADLAPAASASLTQVQLLFDARCASSGCHGTGGNSGVPLDLSRGLSHGNLVNVAASQDPRRLLVVPGQPDASYLLCKVDQACSPIVGSRMPLGPLLSASEVALLWRWIANGAPGDTIPDKR